MSDNFKRMIRLAEDFFSVKNDPSQLDVNQEVIEKLEGLHPDTLSEEVEGDGPVVWILLIPTSLDTMHQFLNQEITESQLLGRSKPGDVFEAVYLCSALVLPEFRRQGRAERVASEAIRSIRSQHPVNSLYVWAFSEDGERLAQRIADKAGLPLFKRS